MPLDLLDVERWLAATQPSRRTRTLVLVLSTAGIVALGLVVVGGPAEGAWGLARMVLPWGVLGALLALAWATGRRLRRFRGELQRAMEHVQLEDWDRAAAALTPLVQRPIQASSDRAHVFLMLASLAEHRNEYTRARDIYETLARQRIGDPLQLQHATIALAAARLRTDELTGAVELLSRLEKVPMPGTLKAATDLVRLFQQVLMGHCEDAVQDADERRALYRRHLSTRAGYGYGLLSAAWHHLGRNSEAAQCWHDATLLIRPERMIESFALLAPIAREYPAAERPL